MFIDTHAHLCDEFFKDKLNKTIENARCNLIDFVVNVGYSSRSSLICKQISDEFENCFFAAGIHPLDAEKFCESDLKLICELAKQKKCIAVGEIGLDYFYSIDKQMQLKLFEAQIKLADSLKLPIIIHMRNSSADLLQALIDNKGFINSGILFHCFSGSVELVDQILKHFNNAYFSFGGPLTFKNARGVFDVIKHCPLDRIMFETDCPYLTPEPLRGREKNEPKNVKFVYEKAADVLGVNIKNLTKIVYKNICTLFKKFGEQNVN